MKKIILSSFLLLFIFNLKVVAQDQHQKEPITESKRLDNILDKLQLDEERAEKFKQLYRERQEELKAERTTFNEQQKDSKDRYNEKLNSLLSAEELELLKECQKPQSGNCKGNHKKGQHIKRQKNQHQHRIKERESPSQNENIGLTE